MKKTSRGSKPTPLEGDGARDGNAYKFLPAIDS